MGLVHYRLTKLAIQMGPNNPFVWAILKFRCRPALLRFHDGKVDICVGERVIRIADKHFPYATDMAVNFQSYFSQVDFERQGEVCVVDYSGPKLQKYANGLSFEIASIPEETEAIDSYFRWYRPKPGDTVFDMGAYCGVSTYFFSKCVGPSGKVFAFEPDPLNYALLQKNIERHQLENVVAVPLAIASKTESAEFSSEGTIGSTFTRQSSRATVGSIVIVKTISFADACAKYGIPAFAKVDIEGSEIEMLSASQDVLRDNDIHFALDTNHWVNGKLTSSRVEQLFRQCGYEAESSAESGFMATWARRKHRS